MANVKVKECELCSPAKELIVTENNHAYVRYDNHALSAGHVLIIPKRHVDNFFDMTWDEKISVLKLLDAVKAKIAIAYKPDGFNIGVNIGRAAGQSRMHVHMHLIPRYEGDVADPTGGIRCVLSKKEV